MFTRIKRLFCNHRWVRRPYWQLTEEEVAAASLAGEVWFPWRCKNCNKEIAVSTESWLQSKRFR